MNTLLSHLLRDLTRHEGLALLVSALLTSAGIVCVAAAAAPVLRSRSARARSLVWRIASVALIAAGIWKLLPEVPPPVAVVQWQVPETLVAVDIPVAVVVESREISLPAKTAWDRFCAACDSWAVRLWLGVGVVWMLWRLSSVALGLRALLRRSDDAPHVLVQVGSAAGLPGNTRYRLVERLGSPMLTGWRTPVIWLPSSAADWGAARLHAVLRHEAAHWQRQDWLWQWLAQAMQCLWWWQPLAWLARRQMRVEAEHAADDLAVSGDTEAAAYARTLVEIAAGLPAGAQSSLGVSMLGSTGVKQRVQALLRANRWRGRIGLGALIALAAVTAALAVLVATKVEFSPHKPAYQSTAKLVASAGNLAATGGIQWQEQLHDFYGTIMETLESPEMKRRALERVRVLNPKVEESPVEIEVTQTKGSTIFTVLASGEDPRFIRKYLDALLDEYIAFRQALREQIQGKAVSIFLQETVKKQKEMEVKREALNKFQAANDLPPGDAAFRAAAGERLHEQRQEIEAQLIELRLNMADISAFIAEAEAHATAAQPLTGAQVAYVKAADELRTREGDLQKMLRTHKPDHPALELVATQARLAKAQLAAAEETLQQHLKLRQARLERQLDGVNRQIAEESQRGAEMNSLALRRDTLKQEAETARQAYEKMFAGAEAMAQNMSVQSDYVAIMERASAAVPQSPKGLLPVWKLWHTEPSSGAGVETPKTAAK